MGPLEEEASDARERKRLYCRQYYQANKDRLREYGRAYQKKHRKRLNAHVRSRYDDVQKAKRRSYYLRNRKRLLEQKQSYYAKNRPAIEAYRKRNAKRISKSNSRWHQANRDRVRERKRLQSQARRQCPTERISGNYRRRLGKWITRGGVKPANSESLLGCTFAEFRAHIERQFRKGMNWGNYGHKGWHVDHIIPCASFDLSNPDEVRRCFHFSNLRPLWAKANLRKGSKVIDPQLKLLL